MPVVIPNVFVGGPGNKAKASEVNANFAALASKFDEGIVDADCADAMGLKGSKLSQISGERVPTAAIEDEAITAAQLAFDVDTPGVDGGRAVSGDHVKALTAAHLARILPSGALAGIGLDKLKIATQARAFDFTAGAIVGVHTFDITTSPALPTATTTVLGFYFQSLTVVNNASDLKGFWVERITSGANWGIRLHMGGGNFARITGNVIIVSIGTT